MNPPPEGVTDLFKLQSQNIRRKVVEMNWDWVTMFTGGEGVGKSTLAWKWARAYDPDFKPARMVFTPEDVLKVLVESKPGDIIVLDEGANGMFARDAMTRENKVFSRIGMVSRGLNVHLVACVPNMHHVDPYWREHRIKTWFHVTARGVATCYQAVRQTYGDTWWKPLYHHYFNGADEPGWHRYNAKKDKYMRAMVEEALAALQD